MRIIKRPYIEETRQKRPQTATDPHLNDNQAPPIRPAPIHRYNIPP